MNSQATMSRKHLLTSTGIALIAALIILFVVVLPAEYAVDATGLGRVLGLQSMGEAKAVAAAQYSDSVMQSHERRPRSAKVEVSFKGKEELEYKAVLAQGEPLLYSWTVQGGPVYFEFHGDPTEGKWPKDYYRSYEIKESSTGEQGSFVAPFTGNHGWYFKNLSSEPALVTLEVSGYYTKLGRVEGGGATTE
jgi:hypothetical protein